MTSPTPSREHLEFAALLRIATEVTQHSTTLDEAARATNLADYQWQRSLLEAGPLRLASLRQLRRDLLVPWNEGVGADVERFWQGVELEGVEVPRKDIVVETLARGRVLNMQHYGELEDHFEGLQTCGKVTPAQADLLAELLDSFANHPNNAELFLEE